jgi:hypothetical protein
MRFILLFFFGMAALATNAQTLPPAVPQSPTTSTPAPKKKALTTSRDRISIGVTSDQLYQKPDSIKLKWSSRGFEMYLMYDRPLGRSRFSIAPGVGIGVNNYYINGLVGKDSTNKTTLTPFASGLSYKKYKMNMVYADLPIELRYRSKPDLNGNSIKIGAGIKVGYLLNSHLKYKGSDYSSLERGTITEKLINVPNLNVLRYGLTARVGYSIVSLQLYYGLSNLFQTNRGPEMYPYSIGVSFNGF